MKCALSIFLLLGQLIVAINGDEQFPFRNPSLPVSERLDDILSRLTIEELIQQVSKGGAGPGNSPAPPINRLGISPFQWRSNPGDGPGTSFPLPINQAATFDRETVHALSLAMGLERRAMWNEFRKNNSYVDGSGINLFAPVANLMRHPLWGRNQETYGEDPYLVGQLVRAFVRGLGGWDSITDNTNMNRRNPLLSHKLLVGSTCKHFAGHTGPENYPTSRLSFEANITASDLWLTYLPAFRECLEAGAVGVMCAYSGINGVPDCINRWLLTDVLREQWRFPGFVVSDCGALQFVLSEHHMLGNNSTLAASAAVEAGVNLENSVSYLPYIFRNLHGLVQTGNISRNQLMDMAKPLFMSRLYLAEFDPPELDPYRMLHPTMFVHSAAHRHLATVAVTRSIVLLHHRDQLLPIPTSSNKSAKPLKHLAVIGPFATEVKELYGIYHIVREPKFEISVAQGLQQLASNVVSAKICEDGGRCANYMESQLDSIFQSNDLDLVVITIGTGNRVEGEGMDRWNLSLPGQQQRFLMHSLDLAAGRGTVYRNPVPVVILIFSTGPVDIEPILDDHNIKAIFWCGFPGGLIGEAVARIMLANSGEPVTPARPLRWESSLSSTWPSDHTAWWIPAARLPFTWYASIEHLAKITDYKMTNQTYRYLPEECATNRDDCAIPVLFPFGYGLSYNTNAPGKSGIFYSNLVKPRGRIEVNQPVVVSATVTNEGGMACEEVVQCYISWIDVYVRTDASQLISRNISMPRIQLVGFERISLNVGEAKIVKFTLLPQQLIVWSNEAGAMVPGRGTLRLTIGGQQPHQARTVGSDVLLGILEIDS